MADGDWIKCEFIDREICCPDENRAVSVMSSLGADVQLVTRVRKKFDKLEETCTERYQSRETRVIATLNFCMTALEQLQSWALFAIFPLDEENSDKYLSFVEQRFQCVINPLRLFQSALQRERTYYGSGMFDRRNSRSPRDVDSPRDTSRSSAFTRPGDLSFGTRDSPRNTPRESVTSSPSTTGSNDSGVFDDQQLSGSLRDKIEGMSTKYIEEGNNVRKAVMQKLQKCKKDMRTIYRWGQASLLDLHDVLDDSLSDELYFLVRGKMQRILSALSSFEEAADQTEKNLSQYFQNQPKDKCEPGLEPPEFVMEFPSKDSPRYESVDLRLNLDEVLEVGASTTPRLGREEDSGDSTRGSTPEPPTSPRPKGLVNHPKIMKDKLQNYALPSRFSKLHLSSPW